MNNRISISIVLISVGFLLVLLPGVGKYYFTENPEELALSALSSNASFSVDQVAKFIVNEDSTIQLIDVRPESEYLDFNIPGSFNIPVSEFFNSKPEKWLYNSETSYIFYSNDDIYSGYAMVLARGLGYDNTYFMKGGMNEWFATIMNGVYPDGIITPRQNMLYETRKKAERFFTGINSLPDSLRLKYAESKRQTERSLDGGCE